MLNRLNLPTLSCLKCRGEVIVTAFANHRLWGCTWNGKVIT